MASLTLRSLKGSPLTISEMDNNFSNLNTELNNKLDSTSYTASDILTKLKTVDGSSSGLDADLLDGYNPSATATASTIALRDNSGRLVATTFTGNLTGNVTGNVTGDLTGNVTSTGTSTFGTLTATAGSLSNLTSVSTSNLTSTGALSITGTLALDGNEGTAGQVIVSNGAGNTPGWGNAFVTGMIMMWAGTIATIPAGWYLCNGSNGTPDLRDRFIIGASQDDITTKTNVTGSLTKTGGSKDAIAVSHTHTATSTVTDPGHSHVIGNNGNTGGLDLGGWSGPYMMASGSRCCDWRSNTESASTGISVSTSLTAAGSSGTNANLPPYYALAFIMKG